MFHPYKPFLKRTGLIIITLCLVALHLPSHAMEGHEIPPGIRTPEELSAWLGTNFKYVWELPDRWQEPSETISSRQGDCEDYAFLVSVFLSSTGIQNDIVIIKFRGLSTCHAICLWCSSAGDYSFFSGKRIYSTGETSIQKAISEVFPDWELLTFVDGEGIPVRNIYRT